MRRWHRPPRQLFTGSTPHSCHPASVARVDGNCEAIEEVGAPGQRSDHAGYDCGLWKEYAGGESLNTRTGGEGNVDRSVSAFAILGPALSAGCV